ncbi:MAG: hypothetical protein ILO68_00555 [Clostridia bacterium]|nr:hypothetical protein [Clostridia bacterium]
MTSSLLNRLFDPAEWEAFYEYRANLAVPQSFTAELRTYIDERRFLAFAETIRSGGPYPLPKKAVLSKTGSSKKRTVYTYPEDFSTLLKLLTHLLLRTYDGCFSPRLYSFRPGMTAKDAIYRFRRLRNLSSLYAYKADIHDYFNSIPVESLLPILKSTLADDPDLYAFLASLLSEPCVFEKGKPVPERKGVMAGTPPSAFYANLYLSDLDREAEKICRVFSRYSDDVILFFDREEDCRIQADWFRGELSKRCLTVNPDKESFFRPGDDVTFLGFVLNGKKIDIAPATVRKIKQKMRRKRDSLMRWQQRNGEDPVRTAKAFLRIFNRKLLGPSDGVESRQNDHELTWNAWFFPLITTSESLRSIDLYAQDCVRYLMHGSHTKSRYSVRYGQLKELGYRSLVHEYYLYRKNNGPAGNGRP